MNQTTSAGLDLGSLIKRFYDALPDCANGAVDDASELWSVYEGLLQLARRAEPSEDVLRFAIQVEKMLCTALGREWSAAGISIESLIAELAKRRAEPSVAEELDDLADGRAITQDWMAYCTIQRQAGKEPTDAQGDAFEFAWNAARAALASPAVSQQAAPDAPKPVSDDIEQAIVLLESVHVNRDTAPGTRYIVGEVLTLLRGPSAPAVSQKDGAADDIEQRTEKIRLAHANPAESSKTHLIRDVAHLLAHIALLKHPAATTASASSDVCAEMRALCSNCGGTGEVHRPDGEYMGECDCEASQAQEAWEQYRVEQSKVPYMPGLRSAPCFIAGYRAALARAPLPAENAKPVAWLKFWAAQYSMGEGNIGTDEGLEVCNEGEIGMDGKPAFPVYAAPAQAGDARATPVSDEDEWRVGEFWSSSRPGLKVPLLVHTADIENYEQHKDFIRWLVGSVAAMSASQDPTREAE